MHGAASRTSLGGRQRERREGENERAEKCSGWRARREQMSGSKACKQDGAEEGGVGGGKLEDEKSGGRETGELLAGKKINVTISAAGKGSDERGMTIASGKTRCCVSNVRTVPETVCHSLKTRREETERTYGEREREKEGERGRRSTYLRFYFFHQSRL